MHFRSVGIVKRDIVPLQTGAGHKSPQVAPTVVEVKIALQEATQSGGLHAVVGTAEEL